VELLAFQPGAQILLATYVAADLLWPATPYIEVNQHYDETRS